MRKVTRIAMRIARGRSIYIYIAMRVVRDAYWDACRARVGYCDACRARCMSRALLIAMRVVRVMHKVARDV